MIIKFLLPASAVIILACLVLFILKRYRACFIMLTAFSAVYMSYLAARSYISGIFIFNPSIEPVYLLPFCLAMVMVLLISRNGTETRYHSILLLLSFFVMMVVVFPAGMTAIGPNKITPWAWTYLIADSVAKACFYSGGWLALMFLLKKSAEDDFSPLLTWGFIFFSIAQAAGAVWCFLGWAGTFQWVDIHLQSAAIWCFYANYIHLKYILRWDAGKRSVYAVTGLFLLLIFYVFFYFKEYGLARIGG